MSRSTSGTGGWAARLVPTSGVVQFGRQIEPEWLDSLSVHDPRARRSRRDLRRLNTIMGNASLLAGALRKAAGWRPPERIVEVGAGDGWLLWQVSRRLVRWWPGVQVQLVDRLPVIAPETQTGFERLGWRMESLQADVFDWLREQNPEPASALVVANLFLHHFAEADLIKLLRQASAHATAFVALEPRRSLPAYFFSRLVGLIGCNAVTRHDAPASVRAGFKGRELSDLWPDRTGWTLKEAQAGTFGHLFVASRRLGQGVWEGS